MAYLPGSTGNEAKRAELQRRCYELRLQNKTQYEIAAELGISQATVSKYTNAEATARVAPVAAEWRQIELDRLEALDEAALAVLQRHHLVVSGGRVVRLDGDPDSEDAGEPLRDDGPVLSAIDRLLRISESRRKLLGTDAPTRVDATVTETTQEDLELQELLREARARQQVQAAELGARSSGVDGEGS